MSYTVQGSKRWLISALCFLSGLTLSGCSTINDAKKSQGEGLTETFSYSFDRIWNVTASSMQDLGLPIVSAERSSAYGVILSETKARSTSLGENIAVFVTANDEKQTTVEVVSQRVLATNIFAADWSRPILKAISEKVYAFDQKQKIYLVRSVYESLSKNTKLKLHEFYEIDFYKDDALGQIVERQIQDLSTPRNSTGSEVGSALASAVYINNTIASGEYNMWTDIGVSVLGGIAGSAANTPSEQRYLIQYTIKTRAGAIASKSVFAKSPIGYALGECLYLHTAELVDQRNCAGMTQKDVSDLFLN